MGYASMLFPFPFQYSNKLKTHMRENSCLMPVLSFNNIPYEVYRHYSMSTESNPLVSSTDRI